MKTENKIVEAKVLETNTVNCAPKIHESVTQKYCFIHQGPTILTRLFKINDEIGTVNICQACELNAEVAAVKAKYNGNTKEMLKQNAIAAGQSAKKGFAKLFAFGKDLLK